MRQAKAIWPTVKALAFLLVLAALYFVLRGIGFRRILAAIKQVPGASLRAAVLLYLTVFLLWAFRLQLLMRRQERRSIAALFPIYMAGVFANILTPGARVGGEPVRAYYMSRAFGGEKTAHLGTILADKVGNGLVFFAFLLVSVTFVVLFVPLPLAAKIVLGGSVLLVLAAVVSGFLLRRKIGLGSPLFNRSLRAVYSNRLLAGIRRRFHTYQMFEEYAIRKLENVFTPIREAAVSPKAIAKVVLISTASWLVLILAHYVLFRGLGAQTSFLHVQIIVIIPTFCGDLSVSPGGVGFMETAMIAMCAAFGVDPDVAAAVTLISRAIFYVYGLAVGGACLGALACIYGRQR